MPPKLPLLVLLTLLSCAEKPENMSSAKTDAGPTLSPSTAAQSLTTKPPVGGLATQSGRKASTWQYAQTTDAAGAPAYKASLVSPDQLVFGFPYEGPATVLLTIRQRNGNTHVYLEVTNGQFNRSFQGGKLPVRFDGKPPIVYAFSAAANGRGNIIFFDAERELIEALKQARTMVVAVDFESQGKRQLSFPVAGLRWNH